MRGFSGCFPDESRKTTAYAGNTGCIGAGKPEPSRSSPALAHRAKECRSLPLARGFDRRCAHQAGLTGSTIDEIVFLEISKTPFRADIVTQTATTGFDSGQQRLADCCNQFFAAQQRQASSRHSWVYASTKQRFTRINVADPDNDMAVHDNGFNRRVPAARMSVQPCGIELGSQWFWRQSDQQPVTQRIAGIPEHCSEPAWVVESGDHA